MTDDDPATWAPSGLFAVATDVVERVVEGPVHVRGRVLDTGSSRGGTQFVTLVDEDVEAPRWDTARLGLVVFAWKARWFERPLGGPVSQALTTGTVVDAVGELGLAPGRGGLQLRVDSLAVATDSSDAAAVAALRERIEREGWAEERPSLPPVLRRVGALISVAGDGDLDEALRLLEHDALAPGFCRHRIHPLSATARHDVPALLDHHVRTGVDAVLIAFGGHLPPVSAWDSVEVLEAIRRAHRAGVPVVAGFAHGSDQPLTKQVAHNRGQASAAVTALATHNRHLLGRLAPSLRAGLGQAEGAAARLGDTASTTLRRATATPAAVARRTAERATTEVARVVAATTTIDDPARLARQVRGVVDAVGEPGAGLGSRLQAGLGDASIAAARLGRNLDGRHDAAGRVPGLLHRGFALVTGSDGTPVVHNPPAGSTIHVTTTASSFDATVQEDDSDE